MELRVYEKTKQPLFLSLQQQSNKVELVVVDSNGQRAARGTILSIDTEGLHLSKSLNRDLGLPVNKRGIIKVYNLEEICEEVCKDMCDACSRLDVA